MNELILSDHHRNLLTDISVLAGDHLRKVLAGLFDNTDDALFEYADKSASDGDKNKYFEAMREVRLKRKIIEREFLQQVETATKDTMAKGLVLNDLDVSLDSLNDVSSLSLVAHDELEETVAIETMVSKLENQTSGVLTELCRRYAYIFSAESCLSGDLDIGPRAICRYFCAAAVALELDIKTKLLVYKLFDKYVLSHSNELFAAANEVLSAGGVLPNLTKDAKRQRLLKRQQTQQMLARQQLSQTEDGEDLPLDAGAAVNNQRYQISDIFTDKNFAGDNRRFFSSAGAEQNAGPQDFHEPAASYNTPFIGTASDGFSNNDFQLLNELLGETREFRRKEMPAGSFGTVVVSCAEIGHWLGEVQGRFIEAGQEQPELNLYEAVNKAMARGAANGKQYSLGPRESDVVNVVAMLFEFILDDRNLAYAMQSLISRLQIPMLRVALVDSSFITDTNHASRRLLNELASAAVGWHDQANPHRDPLFKKMQSIVNRVSHQEEVDVDSFQVLLEELQVFVAHEAQRIRLIEQRTRDMEEGKAKSQLAQREVNRMLKSKVGSQKLPKGVVHLLKEGWTKVLFLTYLKDGVDSEAWAEISDVVDELMFSVRKRFSVSEYQRLTEIAHQLPITIKQSLDNAGFDPFASKDMLSQLALVYKHRLSLQPCADNDDSSSLTVADAVTMQQSLQDQSIEQAVASVIDNSHYPLIGRPLSVMIKETPQPPAATLVQSQAKQNNAVISDIVEAPHVTDSKNWVAQLALGTWLEFDIEGGQPYRAKLSAFIASVSRYVFVNSRGVKVQEKTANQLAALFREARVRPIADTDLFDRAMHSVIANLREMRSIAPGA